MNIQFLTLSKQMLKYSASSICTDLACKLSEKGYNSVNVMEPYEMCTGKKNKLLKVDGINRLGMKTLNLVMTKAKEKGLGQVLFESQFTFFLKKYQKHVKMDLILNSPPHLSLSAKLLCLQRR